MNTHVLLPHALELCREHDLLPRNGHILCAVSGGADSVCLLHWLTRLREEFGFCVTAAHYNHRLRGDESHRDEDFVRSFLQTCCPGVSLVTGSGDVAARAAQTKAGIEETAREMRYAFLREAAQQTGADVIATAHNAEDNAETVLLHLLRGSALRGLTGISPRRGNLIRPLLTTRRQDIEQYLQHYGLPHVEDSSNADDRFTRNRVRHHILPALEQLQPQTVSHLGQTAQLLTRDEAFLTDLARQTLPDPTPVPGGLSVPACAIAQAADALATRMVRLLLEQINGDGGMCSAAHLQAVTDLCRGADPSARVSLPGSVVARRVYDRLELIREAPSCALSPVSLPLPGELHLPCGTVTTRQIPYEGQMQTPSSFYLSCSKTQSGLQLRSRHTGDELTRPGRPRRTVKKLFIDEKIPRDLRDTIPVLDCGGRVAAVAGFGPDAAFLPTPGEMCWHITVTSYTQKGSF